jgi:hypothetical protein
MTATAGARRPRRRHADARESVPDDLEGGDLPLHDRDPARGQPLRLLVGGPGRGVQEQGDVGAPLPEQQRLVRGPRARGEDTDRLVADLPPVAVRAVQHVAPPALPDPRNVRQLVDQPRGDEQPPGADRAAVVEGHDESVLDARGRGDALVEQLRAVATDLRPAGL